MESEVREVKTSYLFDNRDIPSLFFYGLDTFGLKAADLFIAELFERVAQLQTHYYLHPECRHLETKTKIYRNIIFGSYLIIYRIKAQKIEVLRAFHGSRSPKEIKKVRKIII